MLVKNPTGSQITYTFITPNLVLGPGESAEIDNSYTENVEFQRYLSDNLISIIKYQQDYVNNTVEIWLGRPPTEPTINQKGAMVAANSPSTRNPFMTAEDVSRNCVRLFRFSSSEVVLAGFDSKEIWIGNDRKFLSSNIIYDVTADQAIDSNGSFTGSILPKNTISYVYFSGNNAVAGDMLLRASLVAPAYHEDGLYLNSQKDWKFVGWLYVDTTNDIENDLSVESNFNAYSNILIYDPTGETIGTSPTEETIDPTGLGFPVILPDKWWIEVRGKVFLKTPASDYVGIKTKLISTPTSPTEYTDIINAAVDYQIPVYGKEQNISGNPVMVFPQIYMSGTSEIPTCNLDKTKLCYSVEPGYKV